MNRLFFATMGVFALSVSAASAHTGAGAFHGFGSGLAHPFAGLDHILAMIAVGVLAVQNGKQAMFYLPATFVAMMVLGGVFGLSGMALPYVELGIVGSVVLLGAVIAFGRALPLIAAMAFVGVLAIFHGFAHGAEMPMDASAFEYGLGFAFASALLHGVGIALSLVSKRANETVAPMAVRFGGGAIAASGLLLFLG